jgi:HD-GYP domain-containing protein (c-di-GMP phosphodiesterase class II)
VLAVADAFDAMTSDRPYRSALSHEEALAEIERCAGTQFDPRIARVFLEAFGETADELRAAAAS